MKPPIHIFAVLFLLLASPLAAESPYTLTPGVLVLRSGQILTGQMMRQGDSYQVVIAPGSEVRIPLRDVRLYSPSLEAAYRSQRDTLAADDINGRLHLAAWCVRADLPHRAADQLLVVHTLDPRNEGLPVVERRLAAYQMARQAAKDTQSQLAAAEASNDKPVHNPYDISALEAVTEQLSTELVESFAQRVQPLLVNRCGASGCHGYGSKTEYQVLRPSFQSTFTRRYTQRNLVSALAHIDKASPETSPLLERARTLHGGETQAVLLNRREQQNDLLAAWINAVAGKSANATPENAPTAAMTPARIAPAGNRPTEATSGVAPASFEEEESANTPTAPESAAANPLDPATFNRRYHGRS